MPSPTPLGMEPIINQPFLYVNNLNISFGSTTTALVSSGQCRDATNEFDMILSSGVTINVATNGINGLDTGTIAVSSDYAVYLIGDGRGFSPTGTIISLNTSGAPFLPFGYNILRRIGWIKTDSSANILRFFQSGTGSVKSYQWGANIAVYGPATVTTGFVAQALTAGVPPIAGPVWLGGSWTPNAAADTLTIRSTGSGFSNGNAVVSGDVASVAHVIQPFKYLTLLNGASPSEPSIDLKGTSASDSLTLNVVGYEDSL